MIRALAFFGAFNPPTLAHLNLAKSAMEKSGQEIVVFVPSKDVYIRKEQGKDFAYPDAERLAMLRAASKSRPWMRVTEWEMTREHQPRTYETLCHLKEKGIHAKLLIGSDKLAELESKWLYVREIAEEFGIVCLERGADDAERMIRESRFLKALSPYIQRVETPEETKDISSTRIRELISRKKRIEAELKETVPAEILSMIE